MSEAFLKMVKDLGPYKFTKLEDDPDIISKDPIELDNGAVYVGDWSISTHKRNGNGLQIWKDGSIFEGTFVGDVVTGSGRLVHANRAVYEGEWFEDCAQGVGEYRKDGNYYRGEWKKDA